MKKAHEVEDIDFEGSLMNLKVDGHKYRIDLKGKSDKLASACRETQMNYTVSPSGYGIHWSELDEDLSIDGLIGVSHKAPITKKAV